MRQAYYEKGIKANTVLLDSRYASVENLNFIHRLGKVLITILKENRCVSLSAEQGSIYLQSIEWTKEQLWDGISIKLKEVPFRVPLFKVVATKGDMDSVIANRAPGSIDMSVVQNENQRHWVIEPLHRELK